MPNGIENSPVGQNRYDFLDDKSPEMVGGKDQGIVQPVKYDFLDKSSPEMVGQVSPTVKNNGGQTPIQGVNDYVMGNLDSGQINTARNFKKNAVNDTVVNKTGIEGGQQVNKYTPLEALSDIGKVIADTPEMAAASIVRAYEGDKPSFEGAGISGAIKENARKLTKRRRAEASKRASRGETLLGVSPQDVESARQSTGFSGVSAVSALVSGIGTTALLENPIAGYAAGAATSGILAQRMQANSFLTNAIGSISDAVEEQTGVKLTPKQKREASKLIRDEANASGWWEAIPEAIGNVAGFRIIRGPVGAVAEKIATKVLGKKAGKSIAGRAIGKLAKLYGVEVATETVTQVGQKNVDVATGIDPGAKRSFTSPSDVYKSLKEVLPSTLILTTLMGGGVGAGSVAYNKLKESGTGITNANADVTDSTGMYKDEQKIADSLQKVIDDPKATTAQKDDAYNGIGVLKNQVAKRAAKNDQQTAGNSTVEDLDAEFKMYEDKSMQDANINPEEVNALKNSLKIMNDPNTTTEQRDQAGSYIDSLKSIIKQRNIQQEQDITAEVDRINNLDAQQQQGLATANEDLAKKVSDAKKSIDDAKNEISQPLPVKDVPVAEDASKQSRAKAQPEIKQKLTVQLRKEIEKAGNVLSDPSSTEVERDNARNAIDIARNAVSDNAVTSASVQPVTGENVSQYRTLAEDSIKTINNPEASKDEKTQATEKLALVQSAISKEDNKNSRLINSDIASLYGKELKKANKIITGKKSTEVQKDNARKRVDEIQRQISKLPAKVAGKTKKEAAKEEQNVATSNRKNVVYDANNKPHNVTYEVVEADTMDASVKKDESQYRNREDAALKAQVSEISKNLIFDLVGPSPTMGLGAPVEADNGKITAGNGRLLAIIDAYRNGRAGEYKKKLLDTVESLGIDPAVVAGMKNPILRRRLDPGADVSALAKLSNEEGPASMPAVDQAKVDAERVGDVGSILKTKKSGGLTTESKVEIAKRIIANTPTARRGSFMDKDGRLSQEGERRVNNAILQSAYGDTSILSRLTESVNNDLKNIGTALLNASPKVAKMRKGIGDGKLYPADFIEDLVQAVEVVNEIRNKGQDINEFLSQQDSFNKIDPSTEALIRFMDKNVGNKGVITDLLVNYTKMLETYGDPNQRGIFEQDAPTTMEVLNRAISKTETTKQESKKQQPKPQKGNEPGAKESKKKETNVDLLGDNTQAAQKIADAQRSAGEKLSPSGEQPALVQKGDELFASNGKLEKDLFDGINPPKENNNIDSSGVWTGEIAGEKSSIDVNPSEDQINADNYLKAPILLNGLKITVENPAGTKRKAEWPKLKDHYGDIKRTEGADGEGVDVFIRNGSTKAELEAGDVYVIDQMNKDGSFDEHKVVLGAKSSSNAKSIYKRNYSKGWKGGGKVTKFTWDEFKGWVKSAVNTTKPASLEPPALSRSSIKSTGSTVADVEGWLKKPIGSLAKWVKVEIVQDVSSLPIDNAPSDTRGVLHSGTVYIVADNVTKSDVQTVLAHEAVGHLGLERLLGNDSFNQLVKQVQSMKKTGNKRVARIVDNLKKNYVDENGNYSLDEKQESREILAHLAEKHKGLMVVRRIKIAIKKWLARNGFLNIDDVYIDSLIVRAAQITQNNYSGFADKNGRLEPAYSRASVADESAEDKGSQDDAFYYGIRDKKNARTKASIFFRKWFYANGNLPEAIAKDKMSMNQSINAAELEIENLNEALRHVAKPEGLINAGGMRQMDIALKGDIEAAKGLPQKVRDVIGMMRTRIRGYSSMYADALQAEVDMLQDGNEREARQELVNKIRENTSYSHRSYRVFDSDNWSDKVSEKVIDEAYNYLVLQYIDSGNSTERSSVLARNTIRSLINRDSKTETTEGKLGRKDLSILMKKKDIAPEIRALMGEYINDPFVTFSKTATKQSKLVFKDQFLKSILENGDGVIFFKAKDAPDGSYVKIAGKNDKAFAPLNGWVTTPEIADAFTDQLSPKAMGDIYRTIVKYNGLIKSGKTIWSPTTQSRNFLSAFFFNVLSLRNPFLGIGDALNHFPSYAKSEKAWSDYQIFLVEKGVLADSPYSAEQARSLEDFASNYEGGKYNTLDAIVNFAIKSSRKATSIYSFSDDVHKQVAFNGEMKMLLNVEGAPEGVTYKNWWDHRDDPQVAKIIDMAAERVRNTVPTYSMVGKAANNLRVWPVVAPFISFASEAIRTVVNTVNYAASDLKSNNSKRRAMGARRVAGLAVSAAMFQVAQTLSFAMFDIDDDEEEAIRKSAAPWSANANMFYLGQDEFGRSKTLDLSFLDPYNQWKRWFIAATRDIPAGDAAIESIKEIASPFLGADMAASALMEAYQNKKATGGKIYSLTDPEADKALAIVKHVGKAIQPGFMGNIQRFMRATSGDVDVSGKKYSVADESVALLGFRVSTVDPYISLSFKASEFIRMKRDASSSFSKKIITQDDMSERELVSAYRQFEKARRNEYRDLISMVKATDATGLGRMRAAQAMRGGGVAKREIALILRGRIPRWSPGKTFMKRAIDRIRNINQDPETLRRRLYNLRKRRAELVRLSRQAKG